MKNTQFLKQVARAVTKKGEVGINNAILNVDNGGVASVTVAIKGGSRYEQAPGVTHMIRAARNNSSKSHTAFLQTQQLGHAGANFTCENTRDHLVYTLTCGPRLASEMFRDVCAPAIFQTEGWQWEYDNLETPMKAENAAACHLLDQLHQVSFNAGGLSNSNYCPSWRLGEGEMYKPDHSTDHSMFYVPKPQMDETRIQSSEVLAHMGNCFKHGNISVFTSGVSNAEHEAITRCVAGYSNEGAASVAPSSSFITGEHRENCGGAPRGFVGFPGAAAGSPEAAAYAVLADALGGLSLNYEGAGLFVLPIVPGKCQMNALETVSDEAVANAKVNTQVDQQFAGNTVSGAVSQILNNSQSLNVAGVSSAEVQALGKKLRSGPKSLAVKGDLTGFPFVAEL